MHGFIKRKWEQPKLVMLVRREEQIAILQACKAGDVGGPDIGYSNCYGEPCVQCYGGGAS